MKDNACKTGWRCQPRFTIELHSKELPLLQNIQSRLGIGKIHVNKRDSVSFRVGSLKALTDVIIPHFTNYPLLTKKQADFILFKQIIDLMNRKEHLTQEGLKKIASIRASMNKGLSESLIESFPGITPVERPVVERVTNFDLCWLVGFIEGEGCFDINIVDKKTGAGSNVQLRFRLSQHIRDLELMENIVTYIGCGTLHRDSRSPVVTLIVTKFSDIENKIIPLFENYSLKGVKGFNYYDFHKVVLLMKNKAHLTVEGLEQIRKIKAGMNTGRID